MKKTVFPFLLLLLACMNLAAQKIIPITYNGKKYEVLDLTSKAKLMWGGSDEPVPGGAAKSESDGAANTEAIVAFVGSNEKFQGVRYAAKVCSEAVAGDKDDWYLPSKEESDAIYAFKEKFHVAERGSIWTSTEVNATQAVTKYWYTGAFYNNMKVDEFSLVCIRKVE
jgi:hypothetical protein